MNRSRVFGLTALSVVLLCIGIAVGVLLDRGILATSTSSCGHSAC